MKKVAAIRIRPPGCRESGQSLVEFAVSFLLLFGTFLLFLQLMVWFQARARVNSAAFFAAREAALTGDLQRATDAAGSRWPSYAEDPASLEVEIEETSSPVLGGHVTARVRGSVPIFELPFVRSTFVGAESAPGTVVLSGAAVSLLPP